MTSVWLGTAGWSYVPDWVGPFYPPGTSSTESLERYVEAFRFVEVDSTFYAPPALTTVERWARVFPSDFRAAFKAPKELVQQTGLRPPDVPFNHFCRMLSESLGPRLARIVVQMQPSFVRTPENDVALRAFVHEWGPRYPLAIELRSNSWNLPTVNELLARFDVPRVSNDLHDVPDLERLCYSTSKESAYIRLIGRHDGIPKDRVLRPQTEALSFWQEAIERLVAQGVRDVYVVANNHYEGHAPETLRTFARQLLQANVRVVPFTGFPDGQTSLF
jgi:uncharacterized protein YecE (DUF72 family)